MNARVQELLDYFKSELGEPEVSEPAPAAAIEGYRGRLPNALLTIWEQDGWGGYLGGRWWIVNPAEYDALISEWLRDSPFQEIDRFHVFARSSFGHLYAWGERLGNHLLVDCAHNHIVAQPGEIGIPEDEPELAMAILLSNLDAESADIDTEDGEWLFDAAVEKLGNLTSHEVYGFEPALVLGGSPSVDSIRKLDLHVHLSLLRQFSPPSSPGF